MLRITRALGVCAAALVAAFALSGCLKLDMDLKINSDDTVSGTVIMAFSKAFVAQTGSDEQSFVDQMMNDPDVKSQLPAGGRTEKYSDGDYVGMKVILDKVTLAEFNQDGEEGDSLRITHTGGKYHVSGAMDLSADAVGGENPFSGAGADMAASFKVRIAITFPGKVTAHTGKLSGKTVVWEPKLGEKTTIEATAEEASSFPVAVVAGVGGGLLLVILAVVVFLLLRRKPTEPAMVTTGAPPAHDPAAGGTAASPVAPASYEDPTMPR
jgi:hypothetical protein